MTALVFVDGFDKYGPAGNVNAETAALGEWSNASGSGGGFFSIVAPLSTTGYAGAVGNVTDLRAPLLTTCTRVAGSVRIRLTGATGGTVAFYSGGTIACSFTMFTSAGNAVVFRTGGSAGTLIQAGGTVAVNTTHVISWDITIGASSSYTFYLDGALLFTGTGNTGNGVTSVNTVSVFSSASASETFDDLVVFNPNDAAYNSGVLTTGPVVETSFPSSDIQSDFANNGNVLWPTGIAANGVYQAVGGATNTTGNSLYLWKVTPLVACTLGSISFLPSTTTFAASKWRGVAYTDSAGSPGTLLTSGSEVIGVTASTTQTLPLLIPQSLTAGTPIWIGFINDTLVPLRQYDGTTALGRRINNTYTSGAPGTAGAMTPGAPTHLVWGRCTGAVDNFGSVLLNPPLGTVDSQVSSSTMAAKELYAFPALVTTPSIIYGAAVKGLVAKSDSGARTVSFNMKSGVADSTGSSPSQTLATSNQWQRTHYDVDPGTGLPWTAAGLNAAYSGVSVAS